jgi:phosphosulfolactate phosphohydrolase-like enzyme
MKFTVYIPSSDVVVHNLRDVDTDDAIIGRIKWQKPPSFLMVGERTGGKIAGYCYEVERTQ